MLSIPAAALPKQPQHYYGSSGAAVEWACTPSPSLADVCICICIARLLTACRAWHADAGLPRPTAAGREEEACGLRCGERTSQEPTVGPRHWGMMIHHLGHGAQRQRDQDGLTDKQGQQGRQTGTHTGTDPHTPAGRNGRGRESCGKRVRGEGGRGGEV